MSVLPWLRAFAAIAAATALAGCNDNIRNISGRHMQPLSEAVLADLDSKSMSRESPILIRAFKEESELELWKVDRSGRFALLRTYPICRWSGELGPKIQQGDGQAPEGFYTVTPGLMNPNSQYHLAINTGFPNAYDRANGRTGASLMIHGDCASVGCYAMTVRPTKLFSDRDVLGRVNAVDLEHVLRVHKPIVVICMWTAPLM